MSDDRWYPSVEDVLDIHEEIVSEYSATSPGVRNEGDVEFALGFVRDGSFGEVPETIHEKAFHLLRLLVANHPFVDGNKRTALNTAAVFFRHNGYRFEYDEVVRGILKRFGTDEAAVDTEETLDYLGTRSVESDPEEVETGDSGHERTLRLAKADRDAHREIYEALEDE